jgi:hypothetical protein
MAYVHQPTSHPICGELDCKKEKQPNNTTTQTIINKREEKRGEERRAAAECGGCDVFVAAHEVFGAMVPDGAESVPSKFLDTTNAFPFGLVLSRHRMPLLVKIHLSQPSINHNKKN